MKNKLTHINSAGEAHMVDVSSKDDTVRVAYAQSSISMKPETLSLITQGDAKKGDVLAVSRIAGIMASKKCSEIIPLCHPLMISKVTVEFKINPDKSQITAIASTTVTGKTGVEMEALTAATVATLTIYDMCKAVDRYMVISNTHIISKSGGKSGDYIFPGS